jgi:dihydroflavonol-4-reductase
MVFAWGMATLVTGAGGFIGSAVVRALVAQGRAVRAGLAPGEAPDNLLGLDVERVTVDVGDPAAVARAVDGCDVVYHLAAIYSLWLRDPSRIYAVNVDGTRHVLAAAAAAGVRRVVHTSSIAAVGVPPPGHLADETVPWTHWRQADPYMRSKYLAELEARRAAAAGLPVVIVCPAFPFGAGDRAPTPTGRFIVEALAGRVPGYPAGGFCAVDVDDVAACHLAAEARGRIGERYLAGNHNVTYREFYAAVTRIAGLPPITRRLPGPAVIAGAWLAERVAERGGPPPRITVAAARYAQAQVWYDVGKARRELGLPCTPLDTTIARAVRWFRDHPVA